MSKAVIVEAITIYYVANRVYSHSWDDAEEALTWCRLSSEYRPALYLHNEDGDVYVRHDLSQELPGVEF